MNYRNLFLSLCVAGTLLLAACGDDDDNTPAPEETPATAITTDTTPLPATQELDTAPTATDEPLPTVTPFLPAENTLFEEAASRAQVDLASLLDVSYTAIDVLEPDTQLYLEDPFLCPDVEDETSIVYYVYVQYAQFIYPYQFYELIEENDLTVERCEDRLVDEEVIFNPAPDTRANTYERVREALIQRGIDPDQGEFTTIEEMTWRDDALGCPAPEVEASQAVIPGYLVIFEHDGLREEYHTDQGGNQVVLCSPPVGYASADSFAFALETYDDEFEEVEDEVARYDGLDRDGKLVLLTMRGDRVGLFTYESPEAARAAVQMVQDDDVARIYVSGYVLIVQEDNNPETTAMLRQFAEEVRAPISEPVPEEEDEEADEDEEEIEDVEEDA